MVDVLVREHEYHVFERSEMEPRTPRDSAATRTRPMEALYCL